jgi:hypothetical protein
VLDPSSASTAAETSTTSASAGASGTELFAGVVDRREHVFVLDVGAGALRLSESS